MLSPRAGAHRRDGGYATTKPDGVRYCPTTQGGAGRKASLGVPTFDGVPLDVDVALRPRLPRATGPSRPSRCSAAYGSSKTDFESDTPDGSAPNTYHYNNDFYARAGYAVLNYTARGFGILGAADRRVRAGPCGQGYIRLADQRYEARDTQFLLGRLVDQGIAKTGALGVCPTAAGGH